MRRLTILSIAALIGLVACGDGGPSRDASGAIQEAGEASVFALKVGDCFDDTDATGVGVVAEVPVVPCDDPHDNEVFHQFDMNGSVYPGQDAALEGSLGPCLAQFLPFVGIDYFESELEIFPITPTEASWAAGDRTVYCALYATDLSKLTGSMRNSGR